MDIARFAWCFLSPKGRLSASAFRLGFVLIVALEVLAIHISASLSTPSGSVARVAADQNPNNEVIGFIVIAATWPTLALEWKRLQDIGWPGYFVLVATGVLGFLVTAALWVGIVGLCLMLAVLALLPGTPDANRFGPAMPPAKGA